MEEKVYIEFPTYKPSQVKRANRIYTCAMCGKMIVAGSEYWKHANHTYHRECIEKGEFVTRLTLPVDTGSWINY